jgi:hypothetical protein
MLLASCHLPFAVRSVQVIKRAVRNVYEMGLEDFIFGHPAQIALLGIQYQWTADTQVKQSHSGLPHLCMRLLTMSMLKQLAALQKPVCSQLTLYCILAFKHQLCAAR